MVKGSVSTKINVKVEAEEYCQDSGQNLSVAVKQEKDEPVAKVVYDEGNLSDLNATDSKDDYKSQLSISTIDDDSAVIEKSNRKQSLRNKVKKRQILLNKIYCDSKNQLNMAIQQCKISEYMFFNELNELAKTHLTLADRILFVESRNSWGRSFIVTHIPSRAEIEIQSAINEWKKWIAASHYNDTPLMYKCYLCSSAWWRLNDFREHLEAKHSTDQFYCYFETKFHEFNIVAGLGTMPAFEEFPIYMDCLKCGNNYEFHVLNRPIYSCRYCNKIFHTCSRYVNHLVGCIAYLKFLNKTKLNKDSKLCRVCKLDAIEDLHEHCISVNRVHSDSPIVTPVRACSLCHINFIDTLFHKCLNKDYRIMCSYCSQSFGTIFARDIHQAIHKKIFLCRICNMILASDCMEAEHIVTNHSTNFRIVYKCLKCEDNICLLDEQSAKQHMNSYHRRKFYGKRSCFEKVIVPSKCVPSEIDEQKDIVTSLSGKLEIKTNQRCVSEESTVKKSNLKNIRKQEIIPKDEVLSDDEDLSFRIIEDDIFCTPDDDSDENTEMSTFANVVLNVKTEKNNETDYLKYDNESETAAEIANSDTKENYDINKVINIDDDDDLKETEHEVNVMVDRVIKQETDLKQENFDDDYEMLLSKVFGGAHCSTTNMCPVEVKQEIKVYEIEDEEFFEDDIIVLSQNAVKELAMQTQVEKPVKEKKKKVLDKRKLRKCKLQSPEPTSKKIRHTKRKPLYRCTKCNQEFNSTDEYFYHFEKHGLRALSCPVCREAVTFSLHSLHLNRHIRSSFSTVRLLGTKNDKASIDLMYCCNDCKETVGFDNMFQHWEGHLNLRKKTPTKTKTLSHQQPANKSRSSVEPALLQKIKSFLWRKISKLRSCLICKRIFHRRDVLKRHLIEHLLSDALCRFDEVGGLQCQFCNEIFDKPIEFRSHMRDHASLSVFKCTMCCKSFSDSSNFAKHRKTHNFHSKECDICHKKFLSDATLTKHKLLHNDPISCQICHKTFFGESKLRRHMKCAHSEIHFPCPFCKTKFPSLRLKWDHMWVAHKYRKYQADCPVCHQSFRKFQDVRAHLKDVHKRKVKYEKLKKNLEVINEYRNGDISDNSSQSDKADHEMYVVYEDEGKDNRDEEDKVEKDKDE